MNNFTKSFFCISLLMMLFVEIYSQGQKVYIEGLTHDPMSQTAKEYPKQDGNGDLYAIIKVRPSGKNFRFSFGMMSSIVQGEHDGETWLYVQKNARKISIRRDGFEPIRDYDLGMTITSGETYILNISYVEPRIAVQKQWLQFSITPEDATPIVKVKRSEASDYEIWNDKARNLECGRYQYQVIADNYETTEGIVTLNKPNETHKETVTLKPNFGYLQVDDAFGIAGAQIYVDDKPIGKIPYKSETRWASGQHTISITNGELYKTYTSTFEITKGETTILKPRLESNAAETQLRVDGDAEIYVDKQLKGKGQWRGPLKAGRYEVECRKDKHKPSVKTITVVADEPQDILLDTPTPITGTLSITSTPLDAEIKIDGITVGTTPKTITDLIIGKHTVTLSRVNHQSEVREIEIQEGKTTDLNIKLSDVAKMIIESKPSGAELTLNGEKKGTTPYSETLPSGDYDVKLTYKKYCDYSKRIHLDSSNPQMTINMVPQYQLKTCVYVQPTFQVGSLMSYGAVVGGYFSNFNVEASYLMGASKETLYWNYVGEGTSKEPVEESFSASSIGGRIGYGFTFGNRFRFTPQVGAGVTALSGNQSTKANAIYASVGTRADYALASCVGINLTPEFGFPVKKSDIYNTAAEVSSNINSWAGGFNLKVGIYLFF